MGRTKGTYTLTSNIEPKVGAPLDARTVVPLKTDLTANGTFDYPYIGLSVFVKEDNKRYTLIGSDPTVAASWREEGSGTTTSADHVTYDNRESGLESVNIQDAVDEIVDNLGSAAYKDVPESGNADATQVVMGNDSRLTDSRNANDVYPWAKSVNKPSYTYSEIQNTPTLGTAAAKDYTNSVTEDSTDLITSGAVYDALENIPSDDTWRNIKVNGTEKLGTATNTGAVDFVNGTNTTVSFDSSGNKIKIDAVDTTYEEATTSVAGLMSASDKTKLNGIAPGAEVNVQSDWDQTTTTADDYIKNKPTLGTAATKNVPTTGNASTTEVVMGSDTRLTDSRPASDVHDWAKATTKPTYTKSEVGLGNVDNTSDATKKTNFTGSIASGNTGFITGGDAYTALNSKLNTSLKGAANGLAELDADGKVPSSQLPSYVDDVIEVADYAHLPITGVSGKIYVTLDTNLTYRWSGTGYTEISASLALGETSSTAYRGDRGKTAYDHATETKLSTATASGLYKVASTAQGHIASLTAVTKSDITALGIPGSDTNTHRPIQVNGTQNLGDNTTPLNLKNGTNITVTADGGNVTIATSAEVNQNAFSNVKVGSTTVAADSKTDTLELVAGSNITLTPDATNDKITIAATDTNTTYTFAGGTNKFTVTPSGGTAQDVTITPSIANNITGSGTSGYLTKFNGTNTITNGPQLGSSTTTYLRNDGSWATPAGTTYTAGTGLTLDSGAFRTYVRRFNGSSDDSKTIPGVNRFNIREFGNSTLNFPYKEWYHLLTIEGDDNHYATQLALNMTNKAGVYYRKYDNSTWGDWYRLNGALIQKYQTVSTTNKWYKLFTISYSQYNYTYLHLLIKSGFENMYEVFLCLRFTPNGIGAADSYAKIIPYNSSSKNVRLYQVNDTTFGLAVNAQGTTSQIGFELLDMSSEADTLNAWSLTIANPFTELEAGPTAFGNHRYFTGNYADINGTPSLNYLPLSGGTMTGIITAKASVYEDSYSGALNMNNSNIYGLNSIYTADTADTAAEGIHFYRDTTHVDTLWICNGDLLFVPNRALGTSTSKADSQKVGRFTANPTSGQVVITDGTTGGMKSSGYTIATSVPSGAVFTDTKVTSTANHYTPATVSGQDQSASATGATAAWSIDVVKGVTLNTDGKGHVTGISVTSGKIPANPVPSNNITGSGTSGYIAKFNGTNTITNGPAFGSSTTTYLRNDGSWATPPNDNTDTKVTQTATSTSAAYEVLFSETADNTTRTEGARKNSNLLFNPNGTGTLYGVGEVRATSLAVSANNGTSGGVSLYSNSGSMDNYGIYFRMTSNKEKHGYVQGDWATYFTMNDQDNRGWVFRRNKTTGNVASIDTKGQAVFNGSVTVGGNAANTSGCRMVYDSTNECMNLEFAS